MITRLSDSEIETYQREGLVIPEYQIPDTLLERMRNEVEAILQANPDIRPERLSGVHNPWGQAAGLVGSEAFLEFALFDELLDIVEQLIGPDIILWGSHLFCKREGDGLEVPWHQDGQYWPIDPLATVTVRIAIDDSLPENGCMRYIPGSHRTQQLAQHSLLARTDVAIQQEAEVDESQAKDVVLRAGQISLHDVYLLHGSRPNHSNLRRADYAIRYMPASSRYVRDPDFPPNRFAAEHSPLVNYTQRPLWLARGTDRADNDFVTGHGAALAAG